MKEIYCTVWTKDGKQELTLFEWFTFNNNELHRLDGHAFEDVYGTKYWYVDGKLHRLDGPAVEHSNGLKEWCINGKLLPSREIENWLKTNDVDLKEPEEQMAFKLRWL